MEINDKNEKDTGTDKIIEQNSSFFVKLISRIFLFELYTLLIISDCWAAFNLHSNNISIGKAVLMNIFPDIQYKMSLK